jgi:hypothetical protein
MTGAALFAFAVVTVLVLGRYLAQAAAVAALVAAQIAWTLLNLVVWLGCFLLNPRAAVAELRAAIARAEAESAIRRLNGAA